MEFNLIIDPKFQDKIPPLTDDEFRQLEENIVEAGEIYEPIVVWNGVIVDGHNRYKIAQMHPEVKWTTRSVEFADEWAAYDWMYRNQLGRRNVTDEQRTYMIGKMYEARKKSVGNTTKARNADGTFQLGQNGPNGEDGRQTKDGTAGEIANELKVGTNTVKRAEKFAKGVDALREVSPEAADKVLRGEAKVTKGEVANIAGADSELQQEAAQAIEEGEKLPPMTKQPTQLQESRSCPTTEKKQNPSNCGSDDEEDSSEYNFRDYMEEYRENGKDFLDVLRLLKTMRFEQFDNAQNRKTICSVINEIKSMLDELKEEYRSGN